MIKTISSCFVLALVAFASARLAADVVETSDGSRIVGKIVTIHGGEVSIATDYAGTIKIKQVMVTSITTDRPVAVRLASGTRFDGFVSTASPKTLRITAPTGAVTTPLAKVAATWAAGQEDPDVVALRRHWTYEADLDVNGKNGNHNQLGTDTAMRVNLIGPQDKLQLYTAYNRQVTDGQKSADQLKGGVDYADDFTNRASWYMRDEAGYDRVKGIGLYDIAASGVGYDFIKNDDHQTLTGRAGLSYRYDNYIDPTSPSLSSPGADFEIEHLLKLRNSYLTNSLSFVPAFQNLANYVLHHESAYEIPLLSRWWKLKIGVANDYESRTSPGVEKLDTTYFTRLVLTWGL